MIPHRTIVAFSGRKFHGKDTCAKVLVDTCNFLHMNFADPVKGVCAEAFGIPREAFDNPELKDQKLKVWPYTTRRQPLQDLAQGLRDKYPDIWVQHMLRRIREMTRDARIVISDLRYPNELIMLQDLGAAICFVSRPSLETVSAQDTHESESYFHLMNVAANQVFVNDKAKVDLENSVAMWATKQGLNV